MVVTVTVALPLPVAKDLGLTEQVVEVAETGSEQDTFTWAEKPDCAAMVIAFVKVAVWPAATVCEVVPVEVIEKSGGPVTVKFTALEEVGVGTGLTTVIGYVPAATPAVEIVTLNWVVLLKMPIEFPPLKLTLAPFWKLDPVIVRVGVEPVGALAGLIDAMVGGGGWVTVKLNAADVPAGAGSELSL
jgi:hypothetical protein